MTPQAEWYRAGWDAALEHANREAEKTRAAEQAVIEAAAAFQEAYRKDINVAALQAMETLFSAVDAYLTARGK